MVLDGVVSAAREVLGDFCPAVSQALVREEEHPFFLISPVIFADVWVEVIVPSLPALLADPPCVC